MNAFLNHLSLTKAYCQSCNDHQQAHAEWRYRFFVILESVQPLSSPRDSKTVTFAAAIDHAEAAKFLPALPPVSGQADRPNDLKKNVQQVNETCKEAERVLMGPKLNGDWVRKVVDWTLERYDVVDRRGGPAGQGKDGQAKVVDVFRVFGMAAVSGRQSSTLCCTVL